MADETLPEFDSGWDHYIRRIKLYEINRYLQKEKERFDILKEFTDVKNLLRKSFHKSEIEGPDGMNFMFVRSEAEDEAKGRELYQKLFKSVVKDKTRTSIIEDLIATTDVSISEQQVQDILKLTKDPEQKRRIMKAYELRERRRKYTHGSGEMKKLLFEFLESRQFNIFMIVIVFISTAILIALTFEFLVIRYSYPISIIDSFIIAVFLIEAILKIYMYRTDYFKNLWHIIDVLILIVFFWGAIMEVITDILATAATANIQHNIAFKFLKSLRALRVLRALKFMPSLRVVTTTIFKSFLSMGSIAALMSLFIFIFAIIGRRLFSEADTAHFGSLQVTILTLFQLLTLDDWHDILDNIDKNRTSMTYWVMFFYLFTYIFLEYFIFLNLFIAVLVDNFQLSLEESKFIKKSQKRFLKGSKIIWDWSQILSVPRSKHRTSDEYTRKELGFDDYYNISQDSKEGQLMDSAIKKMTALDYQYYNFVRHIKLFADIIDNAIVSKRNVWFDEQLEPYNDDFFKIWSNVKSDIIGGRRPRRIRRERKATKLI